MSGRQHRAHCVCNADGSLVRAELRLRAAEYADALADGSTIDDDVGGTDADYIAPFRDFLPEALQDAGFTMTVANVGGRVVTTVHRAPGLRLAPPTQEKST